VHLRCSQGLTITDYEELQSSDEPWWCFQCNQTNFPFNHYENDTEFLLNILGAKYDYSTYINANILVNPFKLNTSNQGNEYTNFSETDIDNEGMNFPLCDYILQKEFNDNIIKSTDASTFSMIHINIRSLLKNFDKFNNFMDSSSHEFSVIGITETWLKPDSPLDLINMQNYKFIEKHRPTKKGGGVGIYIKDSLQYDLRDDLSMNEEFIETIFIEIPNEKTKNKLVGVTYRPPGSDNDKFMKSFEKILNTIQNEKKSAYILGDFNIDLLKQHSFYTQDLLNLLKISGFYPFITKPTRITECSATVIDNIISNNAVSAKNQTGIFVVDISDHLPIFYIEKENKKGKSFVKETVTCRDFKKENIEMFKNNMANINWNQVIESQSCEDAYNTFHTICSNIYESAFPLKNIKKFKQNPTKPWITRGVIAACHKKNKLYLNFIKYPTKYNDSQFKKYRNRLNQIIRTAKIHYFHNKFDEQKDNIKETWKLIKSLLNKKKTNTEASRFIYNNRVINDKKEIADKFNEYFTNIGPNLSQKIQPSSNIHITDFLTGSYQHSIFLNPTDTHEIYKILMQINTAKSAGIDNFKWKIFKHCVTEILTPLDHICNLSLTQGVFPSRLKVARVTPIYKAKDVSDFTNYRPVSVLPLFSKLLEKLYFSRITKYLNKNSIIYPSQYGFREKHSTMLAIVDMIEKLSTSLENNEHTLGVFLDLSKAFDTIDHTILLQKLAYYGIRGTALNWIQSYLSNREQCVQFNGAISEYKNIVCGVPQGSVLGPLLFLLYMNDIPKVCKHLSLILFADDTNAFCSHKDIEILYKNVNNEMAKLIDWFKVNKLSLNVSKTNYILFTKSKKLKEIALPNLYIDNQIIQEAQYAKFLGVYLDKNLTWEKHIEIITTRVAKSIGIIRRLKPYLTPNIIKTLYCTMILPHITYCNAIWTNTSQARLKKLKSLQKQSIKLFSQTAGGQDIFKSEKVLKLEDIGGLQLYTILRDFHNGNLPSSLSNIFMLNTQLHPHNTRTRDNLHSTHHQTKAAQQKPSYKAIQLWNNTDTSTRTDIIKLQYFKQNIKKKIIETY
jgi:hypothetical protein